MQTKHTDRQARETPRALSGDFPLSPTISRLLPGIAKGAAAWALCQAPLLFSVNPLGLSLLCAVDGQVGWVLVGLLIGLWQRGEHTLLYAASALLAVLLRLLCRLFFTPADDEMTPRQLRRLCRAHARRGLYNLCRRGGILSKESSAPSDEAALPALPPLFDEPIRLRVTSALFASLLPALVIPAGNGFAFYDLVGAIVYLLLAPLSCALFAIALASPKTLSSLAPRWRAGSTVWRGVGGALLLTSLCFCARSLSFLGLSPVIVLSVVLIAVSVRRMGLAGGLAVALLCGVAYDPLIIPVFLCLALPFALLYAAMGELALLPAALFGYLYLLLVGGMTVFIAVAPSLTVGIIVIRMLSRIRKNAGTAQNKVPEDRVLRQDSTLRNLLDEQENTAALTSHLSAVAGSFSSLGEIFRQCADQLGRPGLIEMRHLCDEVYDGFCPDCKNKEACWNDEYADTVGGIYALSRTLAADKKAVSECLSPALRARCAQTTTILSEINDRVARRSFELSKGAQNEQFAMSCDAISHLLRDILHRQKENALSSGDNETAERIAKYLSENNVPVRHVYLRGTGQKELRLLGLTPAALTLPQEQFRADLARILGAPVSKLHYDGSDDGTISLTTQPRLRADYLHRCLAANSGNQTQSKRAICGDTLRIFEGDGGMFYALLCDGMGNGHGAAMTSGICAVFLERVLRTGVGVQTALRLLNQYLLSRRGGDGEECSSTVDLFELDLYRGRARFIKSGAAPSLILREGRMFRLSSHTLPIGILQAIDTQVIPFDVLPGDHILLMSDGITDTSETKEGAGGDWLADVLSSFLSSEGGKIADDSALIDAIFAKARTHGSLDDMSIISIRISEDPRPPM